MNEVDKMIRENYENSKKLNEYNNKIYGDIVCYIRVSSLPSTKMEEIISDLLEMFLRYEKEGKSIDDIIGSDYKAYCDSIITAALDNRFHVEKLTDVLYIIINGLFVIFSINFLIDYLPKLMEYRKIISYQLSLLSFFMNSTLIFISVFAIFRFFGKNAFEKPSKKSLFLFFFALMILLFPLAFFKVILKNYFVISINPYAVITIIIIYWLYKLITKIRNKAAI
ncbi:DUF1048 domain-containing protein [Clostridium felsineum]|uniref:DUF1048 domain-containing protein n=1 Tax=Clostridium felsineum TaxID=36839 RepID=UPI00214D4B50|nr:DUF1048 domain-containing protein [Clostridium felsineum]MCR3760021.1 DUF1048 domain-containing protein [Clostridium felsineum]